MKKLLAAILLFASPVFAGEDWVPQAVGPFGGLNNTDSPLIIAADRAQDLLNVDITPGGKSVKKREGYSLFSTLTVSTSAVHGTHTFYDANGNTVDLIFNDIYLSASVAGATPAVIFSTGSNGATWQCVDSQGYAYCVSTARNAIIKTEGVTDVQISPTANGTMIAVSPERLALSGFSAEPNRIDFSKANDFTTWTVGGEPTDPTTKTITAPGSKTTHITYAHGRWYWFKDSSFGFIQEGAVQADWIVQTISPTIGTLDNTSVYRDEVLYFRGQDAHIYGYDGANLVKLTRDLAQTISGSQSRTQNSYTQTSQSDWNSGAYDHTVFIDTDTTSGNLQTLFPDDFSVIRDGVSSTKNVWSRKQLSASTYTITSSGGKLSIDAATSQLALGGIQTTYPIGKLSAGVTIQLTVNSLSSGSNNLFFIRLSTFQYTFAGEKGASDTYILFFNNGGSTIEINGPVVAGATVLPFSGTAPSATFPLEIKLFISATHISLSYNGTVYAIGTHAQAATMAVDHYVSILYQENTLASAFTADNFAIIPQTFTYTSPVKNAPNLTTWGALTANTVNSGGSFQYRLRSSTMSFTAASSTPAWTTVTPGVITIATGTYFQVRSSFTVSSVDTTGPLTMQDFTVEWYEGSTSDKAYATFHNDGVLWSVTYGAGETTNNRILRYDLINQFWTIYDLPVNGFYVRNQSLYFGSSSAGKVFQFGGVDNDNGSAIEAYWKSKDFFGSSPFADEELANISLSAESIANSTVTVTYTLNGSSSTAYNTSLYNSNSSFIKHNKNISAGRVGNIFNFKFGNDASDQPFQIFGLQYGLRPRSWVASQ